MILMTFVHNKEDESFWRTRLILSIKHESLFETAALYRFQRHGHSCFAINRKICVCYCELCSLGWWDNMHHQHVHIEILPYRAAIFSSNEAIIFACIKFGSVRLMASLGNKAPSRACVMHFACHVLAIFHCLPSMKVLNYRGNRLAQTNYMECFYCKIRFSATIYNNNWVYVDNLALYGQISSIETCVKKTPMYPPARSIWGPSTSSQDLSCIVRHLLKTFLVKTTWFPELITEMESVPEKILEHNKHWYTLLNIVESDDFL